MKLNAEKRSGGKASALRSEGRIPAIVYNTGLNLPVSIELREFDRVFRSQGTSHVIDLDVDGNGHEVLVKAVQMDKRRRVPLHVDFYAVTAGQKVEVALRIEYTGLPAGAKEGGQIDVQRREIRIYVLPRLIPETLEVDVSALEIGDSLHIRDVAAQLPAEAEILDDEDLTLIAVMAPRVEEEPEPVEGDELLQPSLVGDDDGEEGDASEARDEGDDED